MNDESFTPFGMLPSLHDSSSTLSKSMLRVSSTPIICTPITGSPWNGIDAAPTSCDTSRRSVVLSTRRSPLSANAARRLSMVNMRNTDSCVSASPSCFVAMPTCFTSVAIWCRMEC